MSNRQATLFSSWQTSQCKRARIEPEESNRSSPEFEDAGSDDAVSPSVLQGSTSEQSSQQCSAQCCSTADEAFQPTDKPTLSGLSSKQRNFQSKWYKDYPWLSVCATYKKVFCLYCRYGSNHGLLSFANCGEKAFTKSGFNNWKKALEKFRAHEISHSHKEAKLKWMARGMPTIASQLSSQIQKAQKTRRDGLIMQLKCIKYLTRQGLAIRGNHEEEGNLRQLLLTWSENHECIKNWIKENRFTSHQAVNEQISILGQTVLRNLLKKIRATQPSWYSVIVEDQVLLQDLEMKIQQLLLYIVVHIH